MQLTASSFETYTSDVWLKLLESKRDRQTEELIHLTHLSLDLDTSLIWIILITLKPGNLTSFTISSFDFSLGVGSSSLRTTTLEGWAFYMRNLMPELQRMEVCDLEHNAAQLPKRFALRSQTSIRIPGTSRPDILGTVTHFSNISSSHS